MNSTAATRRTGMNVCHVITRLIVGGAQENTVLTCRGLVQRGHRVTLVAGRETGPEGSLWGHAEACGAELVRLDDLRRRVNPWCDWRAGRGLRRLFERLRPDVVHTHSSKAGILGRWAAARAGVPVIVHTIHGMSFNRTQPVAVRWLYRSLERWAAWETTAFIAVAEAMVDQAVAARLAPRPRFATIRSGIETDRFQPRPEVRARVRKAWGVPDHAVVVGTIARLFRDKGYEEILAAMPSAVVQVPALRFVWIGDGAYRGRYEARLNRLGLQDLVHFAGLVPPEQVADHVNGFDLLLHASRWEGLPRSVVQGLLCEVPAVCFDNDGAPEVVVPNETGVLVRLGDVEGLSAAVVRLATDPPLRQTLGRRGRARCLGEFDWARMVDEIERLYDRCREAADGAVFPDLSTSWPVDRRDR